MQQKPPKRRVSRATWLVLGVMIGVGIGAALNNIPVGVAVGIALGVAMGGPPHNKNASAGTGPDGEAG